MGHAVAEASEPAHSTTNQLVWSESDSATGQKRSPLVRNSWLTINVTVRQLRASLLSGEYCKRESLRSMMAFFSSGRGPSLRVPGSMLSPRS